MIVINNGFNHESTFQNKARHCFAPAVLLVSLLIIYWPGFSGDWYLDDFGNIHENPNVHLTALTADQITQSFYGMDKTHSHFNRPLSYFSLALNYYFGGTNPLGYHVVNFAIHYGTTVSLFLLTLNILKLPVLKGNYTKNAHAIALLSAFLWATHPIQVNTVTYIVQRMAALAGLFTVLSLYCYVKARTQRSYPDEKETFPYGWYAACVIAGGCAVASKQNAAMLPFSVLLLDILLIRKAPLSRHTRQVLKLLIPPVVIFILLIVFLGGLSVFQTSYSSRPFTLSERVITQPRVIFFYIGQLLNPSGATFTLLHDFPVSRSIFSPWTTLPAILLLTLSITACLLGNRKWPLFAFSYLFFFLNHVIEGSIISLELIFEHRNYLPSLFFFLPLAIGFMKVFNYFSYSTLLRNLATFGLIVWVIGQAHTSYMQNVLFRNQVIFWSTNVDLYPNLHRPRHNLAKALLIYGYEDDAENEMRQSLEGKGAAKIHQKYITIYNLGVYYFYKMEYQKALDQFSYILKSSPKHIKSIQKVAEVYLEIGASEKAQRFIEKALSISPNTASLHIIKGFVFLSMGKVNQAFLEAKIAEGLKADILSVNYIMGEGHRIKGNTKQAIHYFELITSSGRDHYAVLLSLAELYYLINDQPRLARIRAKLNEISADEKIENMLKVYDHRWNFVGKERMEYLNKAIASNDP